MSEVCWELARQGDKDEIDRIVTKYYKVGYKIAHKWARTGQIEESEAVGLANIAIMKCVTKGTFDETRGIKFTSYLGTAVHNEIRMFLRKERRNRQRSAFSLDQPMSVDVQGFGRNNGSGGSPTEDLDYASTIEDIGSSVEDCLEDQFLLEDAIQILDETICYLTDLEIKCLSLHLSGKPIKELSLEIGYSPNYTRKVLYSAQEKLKEQKRIRDEEEGELNEHC